MNTIQILEVSEIQPYKASEIIKRLKLLKIETLRLKHSIVWSSDISVYTVCFKIVVILVII